MRKPACILVCALLCGSTVFAASLVDINTADLATLETLNGIGPSKAQAIIDYRTQHGPFTTVSDIMNVSGIGTVTYNNIKDFITVSDSSQTPATSTADASTSTQTQTGASQSQTQTQSAPTSSYVPPPQPDVFADAGADRTVIVGADTEFDGRAYNRDQVLLDKVRFMWNFGDGSTAEGPAVLHHFAYPGRYAVVLNIAAGTESLEDEVIVTAEPAQLVFTVNADGSVSILNGAEHDLDLSGWLVRSFNETFTLPVHSVILAGQTIRIPHETLKFFSGPDSELDYPNGTLALKANQTTGGTDPSPAVIATTTSGTQQKKPAAHAPLVPVAAPVESADATTAAGTGDTEPLSQTAAASAAVGGFSLWWLAVLALVVVGGGGVYAIKYLRADEWDITEG